MKYCHRFTSHPFNDKKTARVPFKVTAWESGNRVTKNIVTRHIIYECSLTAVLKISNMKRKGKKVFKHLLTLFFNFNLVSL